MTPQQVIAHYGGEIKEAAYRLNYSQAAITYWIKHDRIPPRAQKVIEMTTGGALKAAEVLSRG